jgi:hypothetical protein
MFCQEVGEEEDVAKTNAFQPIGVYHHPHQTELHCTEDGGGGGALCGALLKKDLFLWINAFSSLSQTLVKRDFGGGDDDGGCCRARRTSGVGSLGELSDEGIDTSTCADSILGDSLCCSFLCGAVESSSFGG